MNSNENYVHKELVDLRLDERGFLFNPLRYKMGKTNFAIFWMDKESKLSLRINKKNKLNQIILEKRNQDDEKVEIIEIEVDVKEKIKEGEYNYFEQSVKSFGKCSFIFRTKSVKAKLQFWDMSYHFIVNKEANISQVMKTIFDDSPPLYRLLLNGFTIDDFQTFENCPEDISQNVEMRPRLVLKSLSGNYQKLISDFFRPYSSIIKFLIMNINADPTIIRLFDSNKKLISPETKQITMDHIRAEDPTDSYCLYYEANSTRIKCVSIENSEEFIEITVSVEDKVKYIKDRLKKELKLENKEIIMFQEERWLGNNGKIQNDIDLEYSVASNINTVNIGEVLGNGASATVYKCTVLSLKEDFALKQFSMPSDLDQHCKDFTNDLKILSKLGSHTNIISFHGLYIDHDYVYLAMEYMPRGTLLDFLETNGPQNEDKIKYFTLNLLQGLQFLHKNKIMHRDLKSPNVLLNENEEPKLSDFGVSKLLADKSTNALSKGITQTNAKGSFRWMAPEVINGTNYGFHADVWSLGVIVTEMITGKIPFHDIFEEYAVVFKIANDKKIDFESPAPLSAKLQDFLNACLQPENSERANVATLLKSAFLEY